MRADLQMPPGKLAAQASHAHAQSLIAYLLRHPEHLSHFHDLGVSGTRIVLLAPHENALLRAYDQARQLDLPCALFRDSGHILPPHFTGEPIITALGLGPAPRDALRPITRRFSLA
nr:aminoacyl-tRNA hydrolase [Nevskia ramosa]